MKCTIFGPFSVKRGFNACVKSACTVWEVLLRLKVVIGVLPQPGTGESQERPE